MSKPPHNTSDEPNERALRLVTTLLAVQKLKEELKLIEAIPEQERAITTPVPVLDDFLKDRISILTNNFTRLRETPMSDPKYSEKIDATEKIFNVQNAVSTSGKEIKLERLKKLSQELVQHCRPFIKNSTQDDIWFQCVKASVEITSHIENPSKLTASSGMITLSSSSSASSTLSSSSSSSYR